jgi:hypothetical protein
VEIYLRHISTSYTVKTQGLISSSDSVELLILGNSHAAFGIDPGQFELYSYNLAQVNQSLYFDKRLTLKHLDKLKNLKFVIITLDFHSLYFSSQGSRDFWSYYENGIEYKNLAFLSKHLRIMGYGLKIGINLIRKDLSKKYKKIKAVDVEKGVNLTAPISKGWFSYEGTHRGLMTPANYKSRAEAFNNVTKESREKNEVIKDLEDFICILKEKNITPILVTIPCYGPYRVFLDRNTLRENELDILKLSRKHELNYWNYFDLPMSEADYYNCDHLNSKGAATFSKTLSLRVENLLEKRTPSALTHKEMKYSER